MPEASLDSQVNSLKKRKSIKVRDRKKEEGRRGEQPTTDILNRAGV